MSISSRHDAWSAGTSYDAYMGRWSGEVATRFLAWIDVPASVDWLEVGCGTGALSAAILATCAPRSLLAIDPSDGFLATARHKLPDPRATFAPGGADALPAADASRDAVVSGLVLNFVPDREKALAEMRRVARPGARIGFYVWDYPGRGVAFMREFWDAATALDPAARDLTEDRRFPFCTQPDLVALAHRAGLVSVAAIPIEVATGFADFDDFWTPFTLGAGPAPGYCMSLEADARARLRERLRHTLPRSADGAIALTARAWAVKAVVPPASG
ncbi:class I SAM-dependent methyltransferase [Elioraea sp.]|uniref:class I SAM-dependent methyltransferase n=1 Tax=Elioraea sp. TaxID=2185103 RepID=UPI0025BF33B9|nr:class I SAM-dependent methyltransferase [Elioraea sp.]